MRTRFRIVWILLATLVASGAWIGPVLAQQGDGTEGPDEVLVAQQQYEPLLPNHRILSYYGFPGEERMGILGEHGMEDLLTILRDQLAEYEAVDSSRPWLLAFEVITSVAQRDPGADGDYLAYISREVLQEYVDFTAENDLLLILDMQFGRKTVEEEVNAVRDFLLYPHVHLALDPEFAVSEGEVPGEVLGTIDAADVRIAQDMLAEIVQENNLPPKILVVHQFNLYSISNRDQIEQIPNVQFVLEVDGWGDPEAKRETYNVVGGAVQHEYYGFKLWYRQDVPLMTPAEVMALEPAPDLVIYQ
jgi:hypothetical protein